MTEPQKSFKELPTDAVLEPPKSFKELPEGALLESPKSLKELPADAVLEDDLSIDEIKKMQSEGVKLSDKLQRKLWDEEDKKSIAQTVGEFADKAASNFLPLVGKIASGSAEIIEKGVINPLGDQVTFGVMNSPEVREKIWKDNDKVWRAVGAGAFGGFEELVEGVTLLATESNVLTDKFQGLSDDEKFRRYMFREATRKNLAERKSLTPDAAARMLSENPILKGITHTAARIEGATPEQAKLIVEEQMNQLRESGLTAEELKEYENAVLVGDIASPFNVPGLGTAGRFTGKLVSKATKPIVQKSAALGFKGLEKLAAGTEFAANKVIQGAELTQTAAKKIGEYTVNDPDTWIKGTVNTANLTYVPPAKLIRGTARVVKDIARQADVGGTAGRKGMVERAGKDILSSDVTKGLFGPQGKGGVARAKIADWMVRQSNAIIQPGVEAGALNVLLGLPFIETAEQAGESFSTGLAIGAIGGSRAVERVGGLIDPRTTMAQKITNLVTPDPTAYRRDEDADIKRFLAQATPELQQQMTDLADLDKRKAAVDAKIANLIQERDSQINPEDTAFKQKQIDGFIKQKEALAKSTPQTQAEALRQIQLAFADSMDLAQATGATAGLRGVNVVVLDSNNAEQFFRNLYGDSLKQAENTISLLTGNPSLTETDSQKLTEARQLLQKFQNDVAGAQSTRGFAIQEDNTDPNSENFVPPHLRRINQQGATAVINADLVKQLTSQGFNIRHTLQHEVQHAVQQFKEVQDMLRPIRADLFDQKIKNDDGTTEVYQQGIFSDEDLDRHAAQYAKMMSPSDNGASFIEQFGGNVEKMRAYVKDEILAEIAANTGEYAGGTRASLDDVGRSVIDWLEVKTKSGRLKQLKETLRKGGIIFDNAGGYSAVLGAQFTPETLAMVRQYQKGLKDFDGTMTVQQSRESDEPDIPLTKVLGSIALQNKYRNADFFEKEQIIRAKAPDGSVSEIIIPVGAKIDPFIDVYRTQGGQLVDADGNVVTLGPEITFGSMPDGTTFETDTRIARKSDGSPIILTNREMKSRALERTTMIKNAIDSAKDDKSGIRLSDTGNGNYRGIMSASQIEAFMALPNSVVSPNLKRMTKFFNNLMARGDGTRVVMEYQAALLNGRYKALSPKIRDEVPIGFQFTKDGNFLLTTISVSRLHDKMMAWADTKPFNLTLWNGDTGAFWDSVMKYLNNHANGEKGETGLHPDTYIAGRMKNRINDLFNAYNSETKDSNPERSKLPRARGKDNLDTVIRGRRLDRINNFEESPSTKLPINYGNLTTNYMPEENPMAAPLTAEEFQNRFDGSVTATRVRNAMASGEIDQLESELRQMDDILPTESLQLVQVEGEIPKIQIVSMFDPNNTPSLESEEIVSDIDAETEAELAILDAQDGTVPSQDIAKVLSSKLDQLYADGGRSPIIPALESELERIYQKLDSQAEEIESTTEQPETEVDIMNSPQDLILEAVDNYNSGKVDNQNQTLADYVRDVVNEAGALKISPDITDEQIESAANEAIQARNNLKQRIQSGLQFLPSEIEAPSGERGFQSKLQMEIQRNFKGAKATPEQMKAVLNNPQNVKAEEVKWSGVNDAIDRLASENNGKVPVQELLNYLRDEGQVKFEEVTLGKDRSVEDIADTYRIKIEDQYGEAAFYDEFDEPLEFDELPFALQNALNKESKLPAPKYAQYQLAGGENYREVVMAMPEKSKLSYLISKRDGSGIIKTFDTEKEAKDFYNNLENKNEYEIQSFTQPKDVKYTSSHFPDIPNYVAHMRLNERTDAEGNDGLFIEELQSDRHQAGREKGYIQDVKIDENRIFNDNGVFRVKGVYDPSVKFKTKSDALEYLKSITLHGKDLIPDAPFRKDWSLQLFKRALRDAVESGKQWIGWTTGIEQVKRYENQFRQVVDEISWKKPKGDPRKNFSATKNDRTVITGTINDDGTVYDSSIPDANGKQLSEVVGKSVAAKILAEDSGTAKGDDLTIGGEGMKGFYDTILPKEIGKYVDKMGGKVEKNRIIVTDMPASEYEKYPDGHPYKEKNNPQIWRVNITPQMENVVRAGQLQFMPAEISVPTQERLDELKSKLPNYQSIVKNIDDTQKHILVSDKNGFPAAFSEVSINKDNNSLKIDWVNTIIKKQGFAQALYREIAKYAQEQNLDTIEGDIVNDQARKRREELLKTISETQEPLGDDEYSTALVSKVPSDIRFMPAEQGAEPEGLQGIELPTQYRRISDMIPPLRDIEPPVRAKAMLPDMKLEPTTSEKPIKSSDIITSAKPAPDAVIKPFSNALVSSAGLINFLPAYHGTPFEVDKFKLANIGTGEGAQAYGWGLYFAQARAVGEGYRKMLSKGVIPTLDKQLPEIGNHISQEAFSFLKGYEDIDSAIKGLRDTANNAPDYIKKAWEGREDKLKELNRKYNEAAYWIESNKDRLELKRSEGNLYKVDIDVKDEDLLDWDKPLSEQSEKLKAVNKALQAVTGQKEYFQSWAENLTGSWLYHATAKVISSATSKTEDFSRTASTNEFKLASEALAKVGIPGIRYLDGTSRKQGEGTYNYVIFDENLIKILDKNDKPVQDELPRATGLQFLPARPIGKNEPLPDFETTIIKGITPAKGFKWDKATNVEIDIGGGRKMSFSYDPEYLEVPKFKDLIKELKGQPVILLEADRQRATGGDMGGPLHPFLKSNQVTITGPDGKKYKAVWANMTSTFVSGAKNRLASHGAKYALVHLMDPIAHKSNKRTARTLDKMMRKSKLSQREKEIISLSMQAGIIAGEKSAMSSAITALKRQMSSAKKDAEKIRIINEKINKITKEREDITPKGLYGEIFKAVSSIKKAISNVKTGNWAENSIEKANKKLEKYVNIKEYNELLKNNKSLYISDNIGNTFSDRGSAIGSILSFKFGKFDPSLVMRESSDFREGENLDIVTAVELSQNPDIFALYFGKDSKEEAAMSPAERKARDEMRANPDFVEHEAYDWVMLGPEKGNNFLVKNPVKPEQIFKKYRETHAGETVVDGSAETVAGAMRKNAGFILRVDEDTQKVLASKKKNK